MLRSSPEHVLGGHVRLAQREHTTIGVIMSVFLSELPSFGKTLNKKIFLGERRTKKSFCIRQSAKQNLMFGVLPNKN